MEVRTLPLLALSDNPWIVGQPSVLVREEQGPGRGRQVGQKPARDVPFRETSFPLPALSVTSQKTDFFCFARRFAVPECLSKTALKAFLEIEGFKPLDIEHWYDCYLRDNLMVHIIPDKDRYFKIKMIFGWNTPETSMVTYYSDELVLKRGGLCAVSKNNGKTIQIIKPRRISNFQNIQAFDMDEFAGFLSKHVSCSACMCKEACFALQGKESCRETITEWLKRDKGE